MCRTDAGLSAGVAVCPAEADAGPVGPVGGASQYSLAGECAALAGVLKLRAAVVAKRLPLTIRIAFHR